MTNPIVIARLEILKYICSPLKPKESLPLAGGKNFKSVKTKREQ